jgi:ribosomal protein L23
MVRVLNVNIHRKGKKKPRKSKYGYTQKRKSRAIITLRKNATYFKKY